MDNIDVTVSDCGISEGETVSKLWHIKGLQGPFGYNILKAKAFCFMQIGEVNNVPVNVKFFFKEESRSRANPLTDDYGTRNYKYNTYLDLYVKPAFDDEPTLDFTVDVKLLDESDTNLGSLDSPAFVHFKNGGLFHDCCVKYACLTPCAYPNVDPLNALSLVSRSSMSALSNQTHALKNEYRLLISVTPVRSLGQKGNKIAATVASPLAKDFGALLFGTDNYSDLKLETKDNMTLSAHKFVLAARSPYFRTLIDEETKKEGFNGSIKLEEVDGKPMVEILQWMYTGEVTQNAGRVMKEVVDAAITFKLTGLLKVLDRELIKICDTENMFDLYKMAKANEMTAAVVDVSDFIMTNLMKHHFKNWLRL